MSHLRGKNKIILLILFIFNDIHWIRQKSGIWGFRSDRTEVINGYKAKVSILQDIFGYFGGLGFLGERSGHCDQDPCGSFTRGRERETKK